MDETDMESGALTEILIGKLVVLEPESRGYNPYDNPGPGPAPSPQDD